MDKLYIVIPAYNEEMNIEAVARGWHAVVEKAGEGSALVVINDGSTDDTYEKLCALAEELPALKPLTKPNGGHGATLLHGYRFALDEGADYVFQTDSDGQTLPEEFWPFWEKRAGYAAIIGNRTRREDGGSRVFVTKVLKIVLWAIFGVRIPDANTPFRLMQRAALEKYLPKIPKDFNLSNVMLTVCFMKGGEKVLFLPITFRPRQGGVNSIDFKKITKIGRQAVRDFRVIKKSL